LTAYKPGIWWKDYRSGREMFCGGGGASATMRAGALLGLFPVPAGVNAAFRRR